MTNCRRNSATERMNSVLTLRIVHALTPVGAERRDPEAVAPAVVVVPLTIGIAGFRQEMIAHAGPYRTAARAGARIAVITLQIFDALISAAHLAAVAVAVQGAFHTLGGAAVVLAMRGRAAAGSAACTAVGVGIALVAGSAGTTVV